MLGSNPRRLDPGGQGWPGHQCTPNENHWLKETKVQAGVQSDLKSKQHRQVAATHHPSHGNQPLWKPPRTSARANQVSEPPARSQESQAFPSDIGLTEWAVGLPEHRKARSHPRGGCTQHGVAASGTSAKHWVLSPVIHALDMPWDCAPRLHTTAQEASLQHTVHTPTHPGAVLHT